MRRRQTRTVKVKDVTIGGRAPVSVQSMTKTRTDDIPATLNQIKELSESGCEIIRCAVPKKGVIPAFERVCSQSPIPVIADIHFDPSLAIEALEAGADGVRVNPCTMSDMDTLADFYRIAGKLGRKVRIGINSGSVRKRQGMEVVEGENPLDTPSLMVSEALEQCDFAEKQGCRSIVLSLKASSISQTVQAYRQAAQKCDYPFHVGLTAAGPPDESLVKSAIGIGSLLLDGIGDTIRVSMTGPPHEEVQAAYRILYALGLRDKKGPDIVSCPTCGRCEIDLQNIVSRVREELGEEGEGIKVALMGCVVNGPGEASEADIGIAGGKNFGFLFKAGKKIRKVPGDQLVSILTNEVRAMSK